MGGRPVLYYSLKAFEDSDLIDEVILVTGSGEEEYCRKEIIDKYGLFKVKKIVSGGAERYDSVWNGLQETKADGFVFIHDGARPMISTDLINSAIEEVKTKKALTVATKTIDTIKEVIDGKIVKTIDRAKLYNTQTPQAFEYNLIKDAHMKLYGKNYTDDAGMLEELGQTVYILNGSYKNIKITTQNDIDIAKIYLSY